MRQEYHYTISRTDRICLVLFVLVLLWWELVKNIIPTQTVILQRIGGSPTQTNVQKDFPQKNNKTKTFKKSYPYYPDRKSTEDLDPEIPLTPIEIMNASVEDMRRIGLSAKVAFNIKKYISAGGMIKNDEGLLKIYGMDSAQWLASSPFILYPDVDTPRSAGDDTSDTFSYKKVKTLMDLNQASAAELESLPGIGPVLAERIIKFRKGLGGFFQVDQLKDCYGLPPETIEKISPSLEIATPPAFIMLNEIDLNTFSHPYLHKRFPGMIQAYKAQHGPFKNASDLRSVYPPDSNWCEKILPYIRFGTE